MVVRRGLFLETLSRSSATCDLNATGEIAWRNDTDQAVGKGLDELHHVPLIVLMGSRVARMDVVTVANGRLRSGRKRTVAFVLIFLAPFLAVLVRSRPFFEGKSLLVPFTRFIAAVMVNEVHLWPHFMVATLIFGANAQSFVENGKSSMLTYFPVFMGVRSLEKTCPAGMPEVM